MVLIINKTKKETTSLPAKELNFSSLKNLNSGFAFKILKLLVNEEIYPKEIARRLKVHEQKIYYHIRNLEKAGIIKVTRKEIIRGALTNYYTLTQPAFIIRFKEFETTHKHVLKEEPKEFLEPFIEEGRLNALIIVGSPDPHGPEKARSRDGYYGMDLALFLGSFLYNIEDLHVRLDTEVKQEDLNHNLILIGGPVVNKITEEINNKLFIYFNKKENNMITSKLSGKKYPADEIGIIEKIKNPFNPKKEILLVAGKRYAGTRAAIIAFLKYFNEIIKGNKHNNKILAKVVEGVDLNSDGVVDDVEVLE